MVEMHGESEMKNEVSSFIQLYIPSWIIPYNTNVDFQKSN